MLKLKLKYIFKITKQMNKSIAVFQLPLPLELIDIICSFTFHTITYVIRRNKHCFAEVIRDITYTDRICCSGYLGSLYNLYYMVHFTNPNFWGLKEINKCARMCIKCGEFIKLVRYSKCKCPNQLNTLSSLCC